jgi:hypothetical protein
MSLFIILFRAVLISLIFSFLPVLLGTALFGIVGALVGLLVAGFTMLVCAFYAERSILHAYRAKEESPKGLVRSIQLAMKDENLPTPRLSVFADPSPNILVVRSLGGKGSILMSQGLIALLNEEELRAVLSWCSFRLKQRGIVFQSFCSVLAIWILSLAPTSWVSLVFSGRTLSRDEERTLSPISAVGFLILFPIARFFFRLGRPIQTSLRPADFGVGYSTAMQKIAQSISIWGPSRSQVGFPLDWIYPGSEKMLLSKIVQ